MIRKPSERLITARAPAPPISFRVQDTAERSRSETALRILLRVAALVWLAEGVQQWATVLTGPVVLSSQTASSLHLSATFFFCVLDLVAATGLWLVTSWGVAIWIATMAGHLAATLALDGFLREPWLMLLADAGFLAIYAVLTWATLREQRRA